MLVGEAWGEIEERERAPFQGMAGKLLDGILEEIGLPRAQCRITNVMHARPKGNNFSTYYEKKGTKKVPSPLLQEAWERLRNEIVACAPNVIVPMGREALKAVLGEERSIEAWRGS
jgi:DNA polymerase